LHQELVSEMTNAIKIRWSKRVPRHKIRRLYESDARGMLDEELLNDVGYGIYVRCQDMLEVAEAGRGRVKCRNCGHIIVRQQGRRVEHPGHGVTLAGGETEVLACDRCSWQITWADYRKSLRGRHMHACGVEPLFESFVRHWPSARSPRAKLLLIDNLIHEFHVFEQELGAPVGRNVIEGTGKEVAEFIDSLAYGTGSTPGLQETKRLWVSRRRGMQFTKSDLQAIARALGVKGFSHMRRSELMAAIDRIDPKRLEADQKAVGQSQQG
jgi:hypothetical protein